MKREWPSEVVVGPHTFTLRLFQGRVARGSGRHDWLYHREGVLPRASNPMVNTLVDEVVRLRERIAELEGGDDRG